MVYRLVEFELSKPPPVIDLAPEENGIGLIGRWHDQLIGFEMIAAAPGPTLSAGELRMLADQRFAPRVLIAMVEAEDVGKLDTLIDAIGSLEGVEKTVSSILLSSKLQR